MAVRGLDGVDDKATLALGSLGFAFGPGTMAAIVAPTMTTIRSIFSVGTSTTVSYDLIRVTSTGTLGLRLNNVVSSGTTVLTSDGTWLLVAATKATGSVAARLHIYNYTSAVWVHENGAAIADSSVPATEAKLGCRPNSLQFYTGRMAAAGVWNVVLSDTEIEGLELALQAWLDLNPLACWALNQAATTDPILDHAGTSDETALVGTTVVTGDDPPGFDFTLGGAVASLVNVPPSRRLQHSIVR